MTSSVSSYSQSPGLSDPIGPASAVPAAATSGASSLVTSPGSSGGVAVPSSEAVTLTPDAQTSTDLLEAARAAAGVDQQAVESLRAEVRSGAYQVSPENLAASIVAAMAETRS